MGLLGTKFFVRQFALLCFLLYIFYHSKTNTVTPVSFNAVLHLRSSSSS